MSTATTEQHNVTNEPELRRVMGRKLLLLFIVGDILGAGVYAVPARWRASSAESSGSPS